MTGIDLRRADVHDESLFRKFSRRCADVFDHQPAQFGFDGIGRCGIAIAERDGDSIISLRQSDRKAERFGARAEVAFESIAAMTINIENERAGFKAVAVHYRINLSGKDLRVTGLNRAGTEIEFPMRRFCGAQRQNKRKNQKKSKMRSNVVFDHFQLKFFRRGFLTQAGRRMIFWGGEMLRSGFEFESEPESQRIRTPETEHEQRITPSSGLPERNPKKSFGFRVKILRASILSVELRALRLFLLKPLVALG